MQGEPCGDHTGQSTAGAESGCLQFALEHVRHQGCDGADDTRGEVHVEEIAPANLIVNCRSVGYFQSTAV